MEIVHFIPPSQRRLALLAAQADSAPVLICGTSGTGKSNIARWIHNNGPRTAKKLVIVQRDKPLAVQISRAHNGTVIIPDVGKLTLAEQKVLLSYLERKSIPHPDGNGTRMLVNTRIIVTASQVLEGRAQGGLFNSELLKKLNVFRIEMPELADRGSELDDIVMGLLEEHTRELHKEHLRGLTDSAWKEIRSYRWPGNMRELRNVLKVATIRARGDSIDLEDLPEFGIDQMDFHATREDFEKNYITELLESFDWQIEKACEISRINKDVLLAKVKKYGIDISPRSPSVH